MKSIIKASPNGKYQLGFTLMEVMVVVVIVTILASFAYPAYTGHLAKSRRASAQTHLMDIAQQQQQYLLDARNYASSLDALNMTTPSDVSAFYDPISFSVSSGPPPSFTLTATPKSGTTQENDVTLTITNTGLKSPPGKW